jgi:membrane protease YdiL (CAAX protease family)
MAQRFVSIVIFVAVAFIATLVAQSLWTGLLIANLKSTPAIPWAVVVMAPILWAIWRYFGGAWSPARTSAARRHYRRTNPMSTAVFTWALVAGLLGLAALVILWLILGQVARIPGNPSANYANQSPLTVVAVVAMASIVGAVTEELGLRGYMLTRLEQPVGGALAVVIVAAVIAPGHAATQGFAISTVLWYLLSDLLLGSLALLSKSIVPGIIVHSAGLLVFFSLIWPTDHLRQPEPLGSVGAAFWIELLGCVALSAACIVAMRKLASMRTPSAARRDDPVATSV